MLHRSARPTAAEALACAGNLYEASTFVDNHLTQRLETCDVRLYESNDPTISGKLRFLIACSCEPVDAARLSPP